MTQGSCTGIFINNLTSSNAVANAKWFQIKIFFFYFYEKKNVIFFFFFFFLKRRHLANYVRENAWSRSFNLSIYKEQAN